MFPTKSNTLLKRQDTSLKIAKNHCKSHNHHPKYHVGRHMDTQVELDKIFNKKFNEDDMVKMLYSMISTEVDN